jgi:hypothetical protein
LGDSAAARSEGLLKHVDSDYWKLTSKKKPCGTRPARNRNLAVVDEVDVGGEDGWLDSLGGDFTTLPFVLEFLFKGVFVLLRWRITSVSKRARRGGRYRSDVFHVVR